MTKEELLEEVDQERKWLDVAGYTAYNVDIVFHSICQNIKALEQEPCEDYISRAEAIRLFEQRFVELQKAHQQDKQLGINWCINTIKDMPPVVHAQMSEVSE